MQKKGANISLKGYDDIFSTDQSRAEAQQERVQEIPLSELHPFEGHPFRVVDDEDMMKTVESVRDFGVLTPAIVRPDPDGGYEIISGHRRHRASELAGKETMPVIVRDMDDDAAIILMVDANLQRETILPSERAYAYKMKLAEYEELIRRLYEAISSLPPMQARRVHARYMLGMKVKDIAAMEGITPSQAGKSIHAALRRLRRYFARQKWTVNL